MAGHLVAGAQPEAPDLGLRDVDVARAGAESALAQEAVALAHDLEEPRGRDDALLVRERLKQVDDELVPALVAVLDAQLLGQGGELLVGLGFKLCQVHRALSGESSVLSTLMAKLSLRAVHPGAPGGAAARLAWTSFGAGRPGAYPRALDAACQSCVKRAMPTSVKGCCVICISTLKGTVATSAPARAAATQWSGWRMLAANTLVAMP